MKHIFESNNIKIWSLVSDQRPDSKFIYIDSEDNQIFFVSESDIEEAYEDDELLDKLKHSRVGDFIPDPFDEECGWLRFKK